MVMLFLESLMALILLRNNAFPPLEQFLAHLYSCMKYSRIWSWVTLTTAFCDNIYKMNYNAFCSKAVIFLYIYNEYSGWFINLTLTIGFTKENSFSGTFIHHTVSHWQQSTTDMENKLLRYISEAVTLLN